MSMDGNYTKKDGEWVKVIEKLDGGKEYISTTDEEKTKLNERFGTEALLRSMTKDDLKDLVNQARELGAMEQKKKDEQSLKDAKIGGGVVQFTQRDLGTTDEATLHKQVSDQLDHLRKLEAQGNLVASRQLSELYSIAGKKIKADKNFRLLIQACPACQRGINMLSLSDGSKCPYCSFSFESSGYDKLGELYNREAVN
jgi:hypothetical protein